MQGTQNVQRHAASVVLTISDQRTKKEKHNSYFLLSRMKIFYSQGIFNFFNHGKIRDYFVIKKKEICFKDY